MPWSHCHVELRFEQKVEVHMRQLTSGHEPKLEWFRFANYSLKNRFDEIMKSYEIH